MTFDENELNGGKNEITKIDQMNKINEKNELNSNELLDDNQNVNCSSKSEEPIKVINIGSRKSKLAVIQAEHVIKLLNENYNSKKEQYKFKLSTISTKGDKILDVPLSNIGSKALFTKELEVALLDNEIDLIVHSCKDLPTNLPPGLCISALIKREIADDVLVLKKGYEDKFKSLSHFLENHHLIFKDKAIGTSSLRRIAQLKKLNSNIKIEDIRGNIDTRLNKLDADDSPYSALILAGAGLKRGGFGDRITALLNKEDSLIDWWYAVGQGALAIECREGDEFIQNLLYPLIDHRTTYQILAERSFMQFLEGGCSIPLGVRTKFVSTKYDEQNRTNDSNKKLKHDNDEQEESRHLKRQKIDHKKEIDQDDVKDIDKNIDIDCDKKVVEDVNKVVDNEVVDNEVVKNSDEIFQLNLSGIVISLDGQQSVQSEVQLNEIDLKSFENNKIDCTKIVLPTSKCSLMNEVKEQYYCCAKLGIHLAKQLELKGAKKILDEINKTRKPLD